MFCFWWSTNLLRVADAQTLTAVNLFVFSVAVLHFLMVSLSHTGRPSVIKLIKPDWQMSISTFIKT